MSLTSVKMSEEVWLTCLTHALTTETEEIMGLLLGDTIQDSKNGSVTALIWGASPQMRCDRRKDRVETNPEQLAAASAQAESLTLATGKTTRVIGWYHSHPHITVLPSHVDVRTQAMYQLLDPGFVGLIFSCYSEDAQKVGRIQVIAFQSLDGRQRHANPTTTNSVIDIETSWSTSENLVTSQNDCEEDTGDSRLSKTAKISKMDVVSTSLTDNMQEALHRSNLEMSGAEYVRKEVPLQVLPSSSLLNLDAPLKSFTAMQHVLFEEEQSAYNQAILQNRCDGKIHPLSFIHHTSTYQASMCKLMEHCLTPAISTLQDCLKENEIRLARLKEESKSLEDAAKSKEKEINSEHGRLLQMQGQRSTSASTQRELIGNRSRNAA